MKQQRIIQSIYRRIKDMQESRIDTTQSGLRPEMTA